MKVSKIIICSLILFSSVGAYAQKSNYNNAVNALNVNEIEKAVKYIEMDTFTQIYNMFQLSHDDLSYVYNDISIVKPNKKQLKEILVNNSFIYIE